jgi:hypothetical protein
MTDDEKKLAENYPEAAAIVEMARAVWNGDIKAGKVSFPVSEKLRTELKTLLNKDIQTVFITDSDIRHIRKKHGQGEALRGQIDITSEDFALIPAVLNEFDIAVYEKTDWQGKKRILFSKKVNGTIYISSVERSKGQIGIITLWKKKHSRVS